MAKYLAHKGMEETEVEADSVSVVADDGTKVDELVVKSNRLVEASYRLTVAEQHVILFAIVEARRSGKGLNATDFVNITAAAFAAMFKLPVKQAYEQIKEAGRTLFRRHVVLRDTHPESGKPRMTEVRWLSAASYIDGAGTIQLRFAVDMVPFITNLEAQFTRYKLEKIANMTSTYAIRLYELLMQWGSVGRREVELGWFKKTLALDHDYPRLYDFKHWVIDVAIAQINQHSDLVASYSQRKRGRVVTHLIFAFAGKGKSNQGEVAKQAIEARSCLLERDANIAFRSTKVPIPPKTQSDYLKVRNKDEIELCIERANEYGAEQEKAGRPVVRYGALYRKAIIEGWHQEKVAQKAHQAESAAQKATALQQAARARQVDAEKAERNRSEMALSVAWFTALPETEKEAMGNAYTDGSNALDVRMFRRRGYEHIGFRFFAKRQWQQQFQKPNTSA